MCQERSALLAVAAGLFCRWRAEWPEKLLAGVLIGLFAVWSLLVFGPDRVLSAEDRFGLWRDALAMTTLWGRGLGAYAALHPTAGSAHSDALQLVAELGVGSLPFFLIAIRDLSLSHRAKSDKSCFVTVLVLAAISFPLHTPTAGFVSALVAGYIAGGKGDRGNG